MSDGSKRPVLLACACFVAFVVVLIAAYFVPFVESADGLAVAGLVGVHQPWLRQAAAMVVHFGDPGPFSVLAVTVAIVALRGGRPRHALAALLLVGGANVVSQILKLALSHDRTHALLDRGEVQAAAFPSGHATAIMSLALAAVLVAPVVWRPLVAACGAAMAMAVSESVLVLGWHFPSDVIGGFLVATGMALLVVAALRVADARWPERTGREAALRAIGAASHPRTAIVSGALVALMVAIGLVAVDGGPDYLADNTSASFALALVAASAAALPAAMLAIAARRS